MACCNVVKIISKLHEVDMLSRNSNWVIVDVWIYQCQTQSVGVHVTYNSYCSQESSSKQKWRVLVKLDVQDMKIYWDDITQITLRSELLSQIRGLDVVLRDRIHKDSRITQKI